MKKLPGVQHRKKNEVEIMRQLEFEKGGKYTMVVPETELKE